MIPSQPQKIVLVVLAVLVALAGCAGDDSASGLGAKFAKHSPSTMRTFCHHASQVGMSRARTEVERGWRGSQQEVYAVSQGTSLNAYVAAIFDQCP